MRSNARSLVADWARVHTVPAKGLWGAGRPGDRSSRHLDAKARGTENIYIEKQRTFFNYKILNTVLKKKFDLVFHQVNAVLLNIYFSKKLVSSSL